MGKGICKYCGEYKELCQSHIIPKSFYNLENNRKYIGIYSNGQKDLKYCQNGIKDSSILCASCDNKLGKYDEYAHFIFYSKLLNKRKDNTSLFLMTNEEFDYKKLRLFFISLLWRVSISKDPSCNLVNIGKKYEYIALEILKNNDLDNDFLFHPIIFKKTEQNIFSDVAMITKGRYLGQIKYSILVPQYTFDIIVNTQPIINDWIIKRLSLNKSELAVIETDFDVTKALPPEESLRKFFTFKS